MWCFIVGLIKLAVYAGAGYWLYDDSKSRDRNPFFWILALIILWLSLIYRGFWYSILLLIIYVVIYLIFRPKGELIYCVECFKKKIETLKYCPWCFHIDEDAFEENEEQEPKQDEEQEPKQDEEQEKKEETTPAPEQEESSQEEQEQSDDSEPEKTNG